MVAVGPAIAVLWMSVPRPFGVKIYYYGVYYILLPEQNVSSIICQLCSKDGLPTLLVIVLWYDTTKSKVVVVVAMQIYFAFISHSGDIQV